MPDCPYTPPSPADYVPRRHLGNGHVMTIVVDDTLSPAVRDHVEAVVRAVIGLHPRADALVVSVVRLGGGRWSAGIGGRV